PWGVIQSSSTITDSDFSRSAFYNEIVQPRGTFYGLAIRPANAEGQQVFFTTGRRLGRDDFDPSDVEAVRILLPHISTAVHLGKRLALLSLRAEAAKNAIDRLNRGIILLNSAGQILFAKRAAEEYLSQNETLSTKEGR